MPLPNPLELSPTEPAMPPKKTVPTIKSSKRRAGANPLVMVTAYDAPTSRVASDSDVDLILVGDSVAMVVLGYDTTLEVTVDDMAYHVGAVARAKPDAVIVGDLPWMSYHVSPQQTVLNAATLIRAGAHCVKIEGGRNRVGMVEAIVGAEIPVVGHLGLTPQSTHSMGGFKVQAQDMDAVETLVEDATALEDAGVFAIVLEGIPDIVGTLITERLDIPTIGNGAGPDTDGQVLVFHDIIGLENRFKPRFVRRYGNAYQDQVSAVSAFANDVRSCQYPDESETYTAGDGLKDAINLFRS